MASRKKRSSLELAEDVSVEILFEAVPGQATPAQRIDGKRLKPPRGARHWFTVRTTGGDYDVVLGTATILKCLKTLEGHTDVDLGIIAINEEATLRRIAVVLVHELLHAILSAPADQGPFARIIGCRPKNLVAREEDIIAHIAPRLADSLLRSGLLRLPPIPRRQRRRKP